MIRGMCDCSLDPISIDVKVCLFTFYQSKKEDNKGVVRGSSCDSLASEEVTGLFRMVGNRYCNAFFWR